jgi:hypothetical protein
MTNIAQLGSYGDLSGSGLMFRNKLINGGFDIWQRGTSQTSDGFGSDDRWFNGNSGTTKTASRQTFTVGQTDVPGNPKYFSRTVVTSVAGSSNYCFKRQGVEGVATLSGQTATLSFWAKADASKNMAIEFRQSFGTGGSPSADVTTVATVSLTASWARYSVTVNIPSISGKILGTDNNDNLQIWLWFDAGSSFNSRTNSLGQQSGTFDIANVQLEAGSIATPFEQRPIGTELALCQRYYWRASFIGPNDKMLGFGLGQSTTTAVIAIPLPVTMRAVPTNSCSNLTLANAATTVVEVSSSISQQSSENILGGVLTTATTNLASNTMYRVLLNASGRYVDASAEL